MVFKYLAFMITDRCTCSCSICCIKASPKKTNSLSKEILEELINIGYKNDISFYGFSGGEPFLYYDRILNLKQIKEKKIEFSISTNCYWAKDKKTTEELLIPLKQKGLIKLGISIDDFHQEFIPISYVKNVLRVSKKLGINNQIGCTVTKNTNKLSYYLKLLGDLTFNSSFISNPCIPTGRGSSIKNSELILTHVSKLNKTCKMMNTIIVLVNGDVYPCCSQGGFVESICLGNIYNQNLTSLINKAKNNKYLRILEYYGPYYFYEKVKKYGIIPQKKYFVGICHLCNYIHKIFKENKL